MSKKKELLDRSELIEQVKALATANSSIALVKAATDLAEEDLAKLAVKLAVLDANLATIQIAEAEKMANEAEKMAKAPKISAAARAARAPRPPGELVGALQDRIHPTSERLLAARPINKFIERELMLLEFSQADAKDTVTEAAERLEGAAALEAEAHDAAACSAEAHNAELAVAASATMEAKAASVKALVKLASLETKIVEAKMRAKK